MMIGDKTMERRIGNMNKKVLLIALPLTLALSGCSHIKPIPVNQMIEDTLAHEEIFGSFDDASFSKKLAPNYALNEGELYTPLISFQHKSNNDGTYSVRFIATIESKSMDIVWTRSVHDLSGSTSGGKSKDTKQVNTIYESLSDNGVRVWAKDVVEKDDELGTKPFNYYAVYCLLNIPNSVSSYYIDAFVTVTLGEASKNSFVGSVNVADKTKYMKYSLEAGDRYIAKVNNEIQESGALSNGNHFALDSISLKKNDKFYVYSLNTNALTYTRYGYSNNIGSASSNFEMGSEDEIVAKFDGTYKLFLNGQDKYYFQKKVYFKGPSWWWDDYAVTNAELRKGTDNSTCTSCALEFWKTVNSDQRLYSGFIIDESIFDNIQFYRAANGGNHNHTGFESTPTDGKNYFIQSELSNSGWTYFVGDPEVTDNSGFVINELLEPQEIHTAEQKAYLSYQGDYSQMPEDDYPDGSVHQSNSNPITVSWNYTAPNGKSVSKYSIMFGQKEDLSDGYTVNGSTAKNISFYNPYLGRNYYKLIATFNDNSIEESAIHHFDVDTTYPRNLTIGGMTNCRDMGGRVTEDGGVVKQGLVYRTSGYKYDYSTTITSDGITEMLDHLKVKTEVNVADGTNYNLNLSGTTVKDFKMDYSGGSHHFSRNTESVKNFFNLLANESNYPVFFHCRIGTDRTGLCAILLSGLLGVSLNEIYQDYLFSNFGNIQEKRYIGPKAGADNIQNYINDIQSFAGITFKNKVYNVLLSIGLSKATLNKVISNLTEGTPAQNNSTGQITATGSQLEGHGVSASTRTSDRDNPEKYFILNSSSKSVSYTFTTTANLEAQIAVYMGTTDTDDSKKIANAISCTIDGNNVPINDLTYSQARMGISKNRTNYFPVIIATTNIAAGEHTIAITGSSNTMNVAGITILDVANTPQIEPSGGEDPIPHTEHVYNAQNPVTNKAGKQVTTYLCDCGKKYIDIAFTDYSSISGGSIGSDGKIATGTVFKWDIPAKAGRVSLMFNIKVSDKSHLTNNDAIFNTSDYPIKINGVQQTLSLESGLRYDAFGLSTSGQYFTFCSFDIDNDMNIEIELDHNKNGYRLLFTEQVRLMYE